MNIRQKAIISALLMSVALNLVFIGGITYRALNIREIMPRPFPPNIGWAIRDLSQERRRELRNELESSLAAANNEIRPIRLELAQAQR